MKGGWMSQDPLSEAPWFSNLSIEFLSCVKTCICCLTATDCHFHHIGPALKKQKFILVCNRLHQCYSSCIKTTLLLFISCIKQLQI